MADGLAFDDRGRVDPNSLHQVLVNRFKASPLNGHVPPDGASWGITTGSPEEWARYGVALAKQESDFNPKSTNLSDPGGSYGLYQFNQKQFGLNGNAYDPAASTEAFVRSVEHYVPQGGIGKMGAIFGSVRRPWEGQRHLQALGGPAVSPSVASSTTSPTSMPGPRPMAQDYTGQYVPDELIRQQQGQAANYWGMKPSGGKFSLAEGLMAGLGSTVGNTQAANAIMNNQRVRSQALADGTPTLAGLLRSGVPEYQDMAAKMMLQQASPQAQLDLERSRFALENDRQTQPLKLEGLRTDLAKSRRELESPASKLTTVPEGGTLVMTDPRTGTHSVVAQGGPKIDATTKKEIQEADDFVAQTNTAIGSLNEALRINRKAYDGAFASGRAALVNNIPIVGHQGSNATTELENIVTNQALQSLRATFGGNPTEGERKILLDVAGSVSQPADVREKIYQRAMTMAQQRLAINQDKAKALRSGTYYQPGGQPPAVSRPVDLSPGGGARAAARQYSPEEAASLPSGTRFVGTDGVERVKH